MTSRLLVQINDQQAYFSLHSKNFFCAEENYFAMVEK